MSREAGSLGRQNDGDDQFAGFEHAVALRRIAGQAMEGLERHLAPPRRALDLDPGVERDERDAEIGRVRRDAALAPAEHGVMPRIPAPRVAARAGLALVAGAGDVVEIGASRALQEVAADRRGVAELRRGARQAALPRSRESVGRSPGRARDRRCGPARRSERRRREDVSMRSSPGRRVMSTRRVGRATPPFIRSRRLVPAAR